jgi:hypothetical protein
MRRQTGARAQQASLPGLEQGISSGPYSGHEPDGGMTKMDITPGTLVDAVGRTLSTTRLPQPSLEDQVTAGINFVNWQLEARIRADLVLRFGERWKRDWADRLEKRASIG